MNINYVIARFCYTCLSYVHHVFSENHHVEKNILEQPPHMPMSKGFTSTFFRQNVRIYKKKGQFFTEKGTIYREVFHLYGEDIFCRETAVLFGKGFIFIKK